MALKIQSLSLLFGIVTIRCLMGIGLYPAPEPTAEVLRWLLYVSGYASLGAGAMIGLAMALRGTDPSAGADPDMPTQTYVAAAVGLGLFFYSTLHGSYATTIRAGEATLVDLLLPAVVSAAIGAAIWMIWEAIAHGELEDTAYAKGKGKGKEKETKMVN